MTLEAYLVAAIGALATVITVLWRNDVSNHNRDRLEWKTQMADMTARIRTLEDGRALSALERGHEMKAIAMQLAKELAGNSAALRGVQDAFATFAVALNARPCMHGYEPQPLTPKPGTENTSKDQSHA
jgi:hypothetical protein